MLHSKPHINAYSELGLQNKILHESPNNWMDHSIDCIKPIDTVTHESMVEAYNDLKSKLSDTYNKLGLDIEFMTIGGLLNQTCTTNSNKIDVLIINNGFFKNSAYKNNEKVFLQELVALRNFTNSHIRSLYPEVKIDDSRPLSIDFKVQSIQYCFCLYFGLWQCNTSLNSSGYFSNKTNICLLDYHKLISVPCNPFKAIKNINTKDKNTDGNTRNLIRLLKSIKNQSLNKDHLSGYKIESIVYAMNDELLMKPNDQTLLLLIECSLHLKKMIEDPLHKNYILSADGNIIFDEYENNGDLKQIRNLKDDLNKLLKHIVLNTQK